jgi:hypothetical protein
MLRRFFMRRAGGNDRPRRWSAAARKTRFAIEQLESRTLLSAGLSATAQLNLASTSQFPTPVFNYNITLTDTGATDIGTFWFSWVPNNDLLPSAPQTVSPPTGWTFNLVGAQNSTDGTSIQWVALAGYALTPGQSLVGFDFSSPDSPASMAGLSPSHPSHNVLTSFVYIGAPQGDPGFQFNVAGVASNPTAGSTTTLATSSSDINAGDSVTFTATVAPTSPGGAAPTGTVSFLDGTATLGAVALQSNGTAALTTSSLSAGSHSITANYSGDATYIASSSSALSETVNGQVVAAKLVPTVVSSSLPPSVVGGAAVHGVVSVAVSNQSVSNDTGSVTIEIFASTDGQIDDSAMLVASVTKKLNVAAGKTVPVKVTVKSLPSSLADGSYTLLARATDSASNINDSTAGPTIQVAAPFISLSETFTKLTLPLAVVGGSKTRSVATISISNAGNITTSGTTTIDLFASTDGQVDDSATPIVSLSKSLRIKPGKSVKVSVPLKSIPNVGDGSYSIVARVTDAQQQISTTVFATPVTVAAPFVRLTPAVGAVTPGTIKVGSGGTVTVALSNDGNIIASGRITFDLGLSTDGQNISSSLESFISNVSLKPGTSRILHFHFKLAPTQLPGTFFPALTISQGAGSDTVVGNSNFVITA